MGDIVLNNNVHSDRFYKNKSSLNVVNKILFTNVHATSRDAMCCWTIQIFHQNEIKEYRKLRCFSQVKDPNLFCELNVPDSLRVCKENNPAWITGYPPLHTIVHSDTVVGWQNTLSDMSLQIYLYIAYFTSHFICRIFMDHIV